MARRHRRWGSAAAGTLLLLAACGDRGDPAPGTASRIEHLVVLIQENTSFDAYFASYCEAPPGSSPTCEEGPACCETGPGTEPGRQLTPVVLDDAAHAAWDPIHLSGCFVREINGGAMDGFTTPPCGNPQSFAYAPAEQVAPYHRLARRFALADRWFQPVVGASSANDMYFARAAFVFEDNSYVPEAIGATCTLNPNRREFTDRTVGDLLADAGVPWAFYIEGYQTMKDAVAGGFCPGPDPECPAGFPTYPCVYDPSDIPFQYYPRFRDQPRFMRDFAEFQRDLDREDFPAVTYVKAIGFRSEHPGYGNTITAGTDFSSALIDAVFSSRHADSTLVLVTYDESGGYFDHVPPPPDSPVDGKAYGPRVPTLAIGRFARPGHVSHTVLEHSSIVRFIEWNWLGEQTGQLGTRDAVVANIGSLLDPAEPGRPVPE